VDQSDELYQQVILDHNRRPKNFRIIDNATHKAEGYNPLCGDHYNVYVLVDPSGTIDDIAFEGSGCAISKASASMMTQSLMGKTVPEAQQLFEEFHRLLTAKLDPAKDSHGLGKLAIFSGVWKYPARVKCAGLSWHTMSGALKDQKTITTER